MSSLQIVVLTTRPLPSLFEVSLNFLVGFAIIQPYIHLFKSIGVAFLDMFFLLNLIALTLGTLYTIQNNHRLLIRKSWPKYW